MKVKKKSRSILIKINIKSKNYKLDQLKRKSNENKKELQKVKLN